jgi:hypothetical protein
MTPPEVRAATRKGRALTLLAMAAFLAAALLAGCASLLGPRRVTLTQAELEQRLSTQFPLDRELLELLSVRVAAPRVQLLPESNRLAIEFDMSLAERLSSRDFPVSVALDSGLHYDATQGAVTLADVRVQRVRATRLPPQLSQMIDRLGAPLLGPLLEGLPVHRFTSEQLRDAEGRGYRPDRIDVTRDGVEMTLVPIR